MAAALINTAWPIMLAKPDAGEGGLDTTPAPAVERLVTQERAGAKGGDLLDDRRPIE